MPSTRKLTALAIVSLATSVSVAEAQPPHAQALGRLESDSRGQARIRLDPQTGMARFVKLPPGAVAVPRGQAMEFFRAYGAAFGVADADSELEAVGTMRDATGAEHVVFRQTHQKVPVFGGELRAHFDPRGRLTAVNGVFVSGLKLDMTPRLTARAAARIAVGRVERGNADRIKQPGGRREREYLQGSGSTALAAVASRLLVFREGLIKGTPGRDHLAYEVEVRNPAVTVREFVYVDAHRGQVIDQITGIHRALDREVSETTLANVIWDESAADPNPLPGGWAGGTAQQLTDWQNEIDGAGETYNFFASLTAGVYDSYDGAGATMRTVNNDPGIFCPNANWNGISANYCSGVTGDDTVAHEWGHAYTQFTSNLVYQWQPGALNESYSDIWGEAVDLLNGRGQDLPGGARSQGGCSTLGFGVPSVDPTFRWLVGEDDPAVGGAFRDMWNPVCYGHPGKVTDTQYWCSTADSGGVHINSGVPNHAFALMVDGGTYNGHFISGLGLTKAVHIHWAAQNMLTPASDFADHADALEAACSSLVGVSLPALSTSVPNAGASGQMITALDCAEVQEINAAVELRTPPTQCGFAPLLDPEAPPLCEDLGSTQTTFFEDFEGGSLPAGWSASSHDVSNPPTFDNPGWSVTDSLPDGASSTYAAFVPDPIVGDCALDDESGAVSLDSPPIVLPMGAPPRVAFDHWVATEAGWDGGNVKVSVNGGPWMAVPDSAYGFNPYNDTLATAGAGNTNPLAGEDAFTGTDGGTVGGSWGQSQVNLFGLAFPGDTVRLRFDFGVDGCNGVFGWYVDNVHAYTCSAEPLPICGDGQLDAGEVCDDGNTADGDGCSMSCQVEDGWVCSDPTTERSGSNVINDGSFEAGPFGGIWDEFSVNFGTPICDVASCGTGTGTGPSDGLYWTWFGGVTTDEEGSVSQSVVIPPTATNLTFDLEQIACDSADDYMEVTIDGNQEFLTTGASGLCGALGYSMQTVDVSAYADGASHTIEFHSEVFSFNESVSNFFVDNVVLSDNVGIPGMPSVCREIVYDVACNAGAVGFDEGIPSSWTIVDNAGLGLVWSNIAGAGELGNYTGGDGDAATVSSDVFGLADFDTELITNSFSLASATDASLDYVANYQNFGTFDFLDLDISTDGGGSWTNLVSWNEDHGSFRSLPGEAVSVDLSPYLGESDVRLRWRYYDPTDEDWDWYAQIDDVGVTCNLAPDCEGVASPDLLWPPNHKWRAIDIVVTDPDGDPVTVTVDSIFQDEAVREKGSGNTRPDGRGVGTSTPEVRAERSGRLNGRVYHIGFTADDGRGGTCSGEALVGVPHDRGGQSVPVDDGPLYDSTVP